MSKRNNKKLTNIIICIAAISVLFTAGISRTMAEPNDYSVSISDPYNNIKTSIEVGKTFITSYVNKAYKWDSTDSSILEVTAQNGDATAKATGVKPGKAAAVAGTELGLLSIQTFKIVDNANIKSYILHGGVEGAIEKKGQTLDIPIATEPAGAANKIAWTSLNEGVATVSGRKVTAQADSGAAIILGRFTDPWGLEHTIPYLVIVGHVAAGDACAPGGGDNPGGGGDPGTTEPGTTEPGTTKPGTTEPCTTEPGTTKPGTTEPGTTEPGTTEPGGPSLADLKKLLEEMIAKGMYIINTKPPIYADSGLKNLEGKVASAELVKININSTEQHFINAINSIQNAIDSLVLLPPPADGVIIGKDGNFYKPVGTPENIFVVVDRDGNPTKQPPEYVYNESGVPGNKADKPAYKDDDGRFLAEDPKGSNIWKYVEDNGDLKDTPAVWGGPDGKPGGGDDMRADLFNGKYWANFGQNVWREIFVKDLGPLTGGGPDFNPTKNMVRPIFDNTGDDGKYYVGDDWHDADGNHYFYGDKEIGGNGLLESTAGGTAGDDEIFYMVNGHMTTVKPSKLLSSTSVATDGRILTTKQSGDSSEWIEVAQNGDYSLIVRKKHIRVNMPLNNSFEDYYTVGCGGKDNAVQYSNANNKIRLKVNAWFNDDRTKEGEILSMNAKLRHFTVQNNAINKIGTCCDKISLTDGFSAPLAKMTPTGPSATQAAEASTGQDVAFVLSYSEAAEYLSNTHFMRKTDVANVPSSEIAQKNFKKIESAIKDKQWNMWLRSKGDVAGTLGSISYEEGRAFQLCSNHEGELSNHVAFVHPALWVNSSIFNTSM